MDRFSITRDPFPEDDIVEVNIHDTYVDGGIAVAQIAWATPETGNRRLTGLVQVSIEEGNRLGEQLHRPLFVRSRHIEPATTRFD